MAVELLTEPRLNDQLSSMAVRLTEIAGCVAAEAEAATAVVRSMVDQATRVSELASRLDAAASLIEAGVQSQAGALALARSAFVANKPVIAALESSIAGVAAISDVIGAIASESRILSLNARIEAARSDTNSRSFAAVAGEMSTLATRTKNATNEIAFRASAIADDVGAANEVAVGFEELVAKQDALLATSLEQAASQRGTSHDMVAITSKIAETVDQTATAIGRIGANAIAVKVLARQLSKLSAR